MITMRNGRTTLEPGTRVYETIIFLDGDSYDEAMTEIGAYDPDSICTIYRYAEQWERLFEYLCRWDHGEPTGDASVREPWGQGDDTDHEHDGYVVTWNASLGHVALCRVFEAPDGFTVGGAL